MKTVRPPKRHRRYIPFQRQTRLTLAIGLLFAMCLVARVPLTQSKTSTATTDSPKVVRRYPVQEGRPKQRQGTIDFGQKLTTPIRQASDSEEDGPFAERGITPGSSEGRFKPGRLQVTSAESKLPDKEGALKRPEPLEEAGALLVVIRQWIGGMQIDGSSGTPDSPNERNTGELGQDRGNADDVRDNSIVETIGSQGQSRETQRANDHLVLRLTNPLDMQGEVRYKINGREHLLFPGQSHEITGDQAWHVKFHRGGDFGYAQYVLRPGSYAFTATDKGWDLSDMDVTY